MGRFVAGRQRHRQPIDVAGNKRIGGIGIALTGDTVAKNVGLEVSVRVPPGGVEAKLNIAIEMPMAQSRKAVKIRRLKNADSEKEEFRFISQGESTVAGFSRASAASFRGGARPFER